MTPTERNDNLSNDRPSGDALSAGALLRLAADDELTPDERARLEAHLGAHPDDRARIDAERALRARVGALLDRSPAAPASLRASVENILASASDDAPVVIRRTDQSFWRRSLTPFAIAAGLLLVVSASIIVRQVGLQSGIAAWMTESQGAQAAAFVEREHSRCAGLDDQRNTKFVTDTLEGANDLIAERLGATGATIDLSSQGLTLTGAGACSVPGEGKSVHLLYRGGAGDDAWAASLFIQTGDPDFEGVDPKCLCLNRLTDREEVLVWRRDGLVYYLVCPPGGSAVTLLEALDAPTRRTLL